MTDYEINYPQNIRGGAGFFPEEGKVVIEGYNGAEIVLTESGSQPNGDIPDDIYSLIEKGSFNADPLWKLQSVAVMDGVEQHPTVGSNGVAIGSYLIDKLRREVVVRYFLGMSNGDLGTTSGDGTSRYYLQLPDEVPGFDVTVNEVGPVRAWIAGSGEKEFNGVAAGYSVIDRAIVITLGNQIWHRTTPKLFSSGSHISVKISYDY